MKPTTRRRFLTDYYDSVQQRSYPSSSPQSVEPDQLFLGRLRLDTLLSRSLILTDAMLLDGAFFARIEPAQLISSLKRSDDQLAPLEIRCRAPSIEESCIRLLKQSGVPMLKPFAFSVVGDDSLRAAIAHSLSEMPATCINSLRDLPSALQAAGMPREDAERLLGGWRKWIEAEHAHLILTHVWESAFDLDAALGDPALHNQQLITPEGRDFAKWAYSVRPDRTRVDIAFASLMAEYDGELATDLLSTLSWLYRGYNRALAWQHDCDNFESVFFTLDLALRPASPLPPLAPQDALEPIELPPELLIALGIMPSATYRHSYYVARDSYTKWWEEGDTAALRKALDPLLENIMSLPSSTPAQELRRDLLVAAAAVGGALAGGALDDPIGSAFGAAVGPMARLCLNYIKHASATRRRAHLAQRIMRVAEGRTNNGSEDIPHR